MRARRPGCARRPPRRTERCLIAAGTGLGPVHLSVTDGGRALRFGEDRQSCRHRNTDKAITLALLRNAAGLTSPALSGKEEAMAEALIRQRVEDAAKARHKLSLANPAN